MPIKKRKSTKNKNTETVGSPNWNIKEATSRMLGRMITDLKQQYESTGLPNEDICNYISGTLTTIVDSVNQMNMTSDALDTYNNEWARFRDTYSSWNDIGYASTPSTNEQITQEQITQRDNLAKQLEKTLEKIKEVQNGLISNSQLGFIDKNLSDQILEAIVGLSDNLSEINPEPILKTFQQRVMEARSRHLISF